MIRIRYSQNEYELAGSAGELRALSDRLRRLATAGGEDAIACDATFDPKPYTGLLRRLRLSKNAEKDRVSTSHGELVLSGSSEGLLRLASFFDIPDEVERGFHTHHEYFPGNDFVAPDSLPLVIMVESAVR